MAPKHRAGRLCSDDGRPYTKTHSFLKGELNMSGIVDLSKYLQNDWIKFDYLSRVGPQRRMIIGIEESDIEGNVMPELLFDDTGFEDEPSRFRLNKTNLSILIELLGPNPRNYIGKEILMSPFVDRSKKGNYRNQVSVELAPPENSAQQQQVAGIDVSKLTPEQIAALQAASQSPSSESQGVAQAAREGIGSTGEPDF